VCKFSTLVKDSLNTTNVGSDIKLVVSLAASLLCEALVCISIGDTGVKLVNVDVLLTNELSEILDFN